MSFDYQKIFDLLKQELDTEFEDKPEVLDNWEDLDEDFRNFRNHLLFCLQHSLSNIFFKQITFEQAMIDFYEYLKNPHYFDDDEPESRDDRILTISENQSTLSKPQKASYYRWTSLSIDIEDPSWASNVNIVDMFIEPLPEYLETVFTKSINTLTGWNQVGFCNFDLMCYTSGLRKVAENLPVNNLQVITVSEVKVLCEIFKILIEN